MDQVLAMLRAAADPTRLRLLMLLSEAELTVSEITEILGQSQPRASRHLQLLCDAGLLDRIKEGAWVFYRGSDTTAAAALVRAFAQLTIAGADPILRDDEKRLQQVRAERARQAAKYFAANAAQWEKIRALHVSESEVERAVISLLRRASLHQVLDAGTGTGRMLELLAPHIRRGIGIDSSPEMLTIARDRLANAGILNCQVRRGDVYRLPFPDGDARDGFDAVLFHQVLHFLDDPQTAIREANRVLRSGGRFLFFLNHPLLQTPGSGWIDDRILDEQYWRIGPYLIEDRSLEEVEKDVHIPFVHRPLSRYVNAMVAADLFVERMEEPAPPPGFLARAEEYKEAATIPRLLFLVTRKGRR